MRRARLLVLAVVTIATLSPWEAAAQTATPPPGPTPASDRPAPSPAASSPLAPSVVAHVGRDGVGVGVALGLGGSGVVRVALAGAESGPVTVSTFNVCGGPANWPCNTARSDVRTQHGALSLAVLGRGTAWNGVRLVVGVDATGRVERQTETPRSAPPNATEWTAETTVRRRLSFRPGLLAGLDVSLTPRLGVTVEGSAATPLFGSDTPGWRSLDRYRPFRAAVGFRAAW